MHFEAGRCTLHMHDAEDTLFQGSIQINAPIAARAQLRVIRSIYESFTPDRALHLTFSLLFVR